MGLFIGTKAEFEASRGRRNKAGGGAQPVKRKLNAFEKQFVASRRAGKTSFSFGGKSYSTKLAGPGKAPAKNKTATVATSVPKPAQKPTAVAAKSTSVTLPKRAPLSQPRPTSTAGVPLPQPRPASPSDRAARRDRAYQTNLGDDAGVGDTTFDKMRKGMQAAQAGAEMQRPRKAATDLGYSARDAAYKRKTMENVLGSPSPRGTAVRTASVAKPTSNVSATISTSMPKPTVTTPKTDRLTAPKYYVGKRIAPRAVKTTRVAATGPQPPANTFAPKSPPAAKGGRVKKGAKVTSRPGGVFDQSNYRRFQFTTPKSR